MKSWIEKEGNREKSPPSLSDTHKLTFVVFTKLFPCFAMYISSFQDFKKTKQNCDSSVPWKENEMQGMERQPPVVSSHFPVLQHVMIFLSLMVL